MITLDEEMIGAKKDEEYRVSQLNPNIGDLKGDHWISPRVFRYLVTLCFSSATDKNVDGSRAGVSHAIQNGESHHESPASERTCEDQSPLQKCSTNARTATESSQRASLEKDIEHLQVRLQQEKSMRMVLEKAMGRASSTLSPGHTQFSTQAKELITEIELLEEEVANREQHVLSLYRSIFEQCVSRAPSEESSGMASPAHTKNENKKHPSIISSTFCSSKNFPLRPFQVLASKTDSGKRSFSLHSKTRQASLLGGKDNATLEKTRSSHGKVQEEKNSVLRTLKDHLYQCPSKLSEEMVRCMAAVYCWLCSSSNIEQKKRGTSDERDLSCKSMVEIFSISTDKNNFARASYSINNYSIRHLVEQLEKVNVTRMEANAKTAFWINTYNALVMHAYLAYGIPHRSLKRLARYHKASYTISGHIVSANAIEQSIFCLHTPPVGRWFELIFSTALRKRSGEQKQKISSKFSLLKPEPLVCFALCTGDFSDPALRVYTASSVIEELELAKREFLQSKIVVKKSRKVFLPKVLERFLKEASMELDDLINFVSESVDKKLSDSIHKCTDWKTGKKAYHVIEWLSYNPRFRVEKIDLSRIYRKLKISGTLLCVVGALTLRVMHSTSQPQTAKQVESLVTDPNTSMFDIQKIIGCIYLVAAFFVLSSNVVMQASTLAEFPAPISLCAITSLLGMISTTVCELIWYHNFDYGWPFVSIRDMAGYSLFGGIVSGVCVSFTGWAMKKRGPVLVSMFSLIGTVISVILSYFTMGELISFGSITGMFLMFSGLSFYGLKAEKNNFTLDEM